MPGLLGERIETHLSVHDNGHNNLALRVAVARDVARKQIHVRHELRLTARSGRTADPSTERNHLASDFALEGSQDKLRLLAYCCP